MCLPSWDYSRRKMPSLGTCILVCFLSSLMLALVRVAAASEPCRSHSAPVLRGSPDGCEKASGHVLNPHETIDWEMPVAGSGSQARPDALSMRPLTNARSDSGLGALDVSGPSTRTLNVPASTERIGIPVVPYDAIFRPARMRARHSLHFLYNEDEVWPSDLEDASITDYTADEDISNLSHGGGTLATPQAPIPPIIPVDTPGYEGEDEEEEGEEGEDEAPPPAALPRNETEAVGAPSPAEKAAASGIGHDFWATIEDGEEERIARDTSGHRFNESLGSHHATLETVARVVRKRRRRRHRSPPPSGNSTLGAGKDEKGGGDGDTGSKVGTFLGELVEGVTKGSLWIEAAVDPMINAVDSSQKKGATTEAAAPSEEGETGGTPRERMGDEDGGGGGLGGGESEAVVGGKSDGGGGGDMGEVLDVAAQGLGEGQERESGGVSLVGAGEGGGLGDIRMDLQDGESVIPSVDYGTLSLQASVLAAGDADGSADVDGGMLADAGGTDTLAIGTDADDAAESTSTAAAAAEAAARAAAAAVMSDSAALAATANVDTSQPASVTPAGADSKNNNNHNSAAATPVVSAAAVDAEEDGDDFEDGEYEDDGGVARLIDSEDNEYVISNPGKGLGRMQMQVDVELISDMGQILVAAALGGLAAGLLGQPVMLGYLLAGSFVGPGGLALINELVQVETLAQFGVVFLLFGLGVEFSASRLQPVRHVALAGGCLSMVLFALAGVLAGYLMGSSTAHGGFVGAIISMSSTPVVLKCLMDDNATNSLHGQVMVGLLIFQDFTLGLLLALMHALASDDASGTAVLLSLLREGCVLALFLLAAWVTARLLVPRYLALLESLSKSSHDLYLLGVLSVCLCVALASELLDLSLEVGAFVGGLMLSGSKYSGRILQQLESVRNIFAALFFAAIEGRTSTNRSDLNV
eukprot:jgi/Mesvir1/18655/Mv17157-RA.2